MCGGSSSLAVGYIANAMQRVGCDQRPGSGKKFDQCGKCGEDGQSCIDCNGDVIRNRANSK